MKIIVIDNYDSFTFNLVHLVHSFASSIEVYRNDEISLDEIEAKNIDAILISPGPCTPQSSGITLSVIRKFKGIIPIFGVCLGMQAIAILYQYKVGVGKNPRHGKTSIIRHNFDPLFKNIPELFEATRYHSLIAQPETNIHNDLKITAISEDDNMVMCIADENHCVYGVQFHPESIASQYGEAIMQNFFERAAEFNRKKNNNLLQSQG